MSEAEYYRCGSKDSPIEIPAASARSGWSFAQGGEDGGAPRLLALWLKNGRDTAAGRHSRPASPAGYRRARIYRELACAAERRVE